MSTKIQLTRALGVATMAALTVGFAASAQASPVPPKASSALVGTWVNTNANSNSVKQVNIAPLSNGSVSVDAFGSCTPTFCEWGKVPAVVYGTSVSSPTGATFQTRQRFLTGSTEWSRTTLFGKVARTDSGLRLTLREMTAFTDGSGRKNYSRTETFKLGKGQASTISGHSVTGYVHGTAPALTAPALGTWVNPTPSGGLVKVKIGGTVAHPTVHAYGQCSPTPCDLGTVNAATYGTSISSAQGATLLAPYVFGFKKSQLVISYANVLGHPRLSVTSYNEFTDGSGRSNYAKAESFVRA